MALRALQGPTGGGSPVGGSGTSSPSTIPRWTGPSTLGDSGLIDNGTAIYTTARNAIGFNTATPTANTFNFGASRFAFFDDSQTKLGDDGIIRGLAATGDTGLSYFTSKAFNIRRANTFVATFDTNGNVGIGTASPATIGHVRGANVAYRGQFTIEQTGGTVAQATWYNGATSATNLVGQVYADAPGSGNKFHISAYQADGAILFETGTTNTERARIDSNGNIYGTSGTTGMTNGFFYIPAAAGAPTGVPTAVAGRVPMYYDTTNNQFYVYNGAWKKVTLA